MRGLLTRVSALLRRPATLQLQPSGETLEEQQIIIEDAGGVLHEQQIEGAAVEVGRALW